jgi:protein TonB
MAPQKTMFGDIVQPSVNVGTRRWYSIPLSIAIHALAVLTLIVIPLMAYDVLPTPNSAMESFRTVALPPLPSPPPPRAVSKPVVAVANPDLAPVVAPPTIAPEPPDLGFDRALDGAAPLGVLDGGDPLPIPPPLTATSPATLPPVRVGGEIKRPVKTKDASPVYPPIAVISRVQGVVIIEATIGVDGAVQEAKVLRSIPLLDSAALDAVRQWEFSPTLLNGEPVPVIMTVTVQFMLAR